MDQAFIDRVQADLNAGAEEVRAQLRANVEEYGPDGVGPEPAAIYQFIEDEVGRLETRICEWEALMSQLETFPQLFIGV